MKRALILMLIAWNDGVFAREVYIDGDVILGGLFPIHGWKLNEHKLPVCDDNIQYEYGIQPLETMIFSVKRMNDLGLLKNFTLGLWALDYCSNPYIARLQSLKFFAAIASQGTSDLTCQHKSDEGRKGPIAVIGADSSAETLEIAPMMSAVSLPLVSYSATSPMLSDKNLYPHFFRTVPNDKYMGMAIISILERLKWNYASIVYSSTIFGIAGYRSFISAKTHHTNICFGPSYMITHTFEDMDYDDLVNKIYTDYHPPVVIMFAEKIIIKNMIDAVWKKNISSPSITWIIGDSVDLTIRDTHKWGYVIGGGLVVRPEIETSWLPKFRQHFKKVIIDRSSDTNPWIREFVDQYDLCIEGKNFRQHKPETPCVTYKEGRLSGNLNTAVHAIGYTIQNVIEKKCNGNVSENCDYKMVSRRDILKHLGNVTFKDHMKRQFSFVDGSEGPASYTIFLIRSRYKNQNDTSKYKWDFVGHFHASNMTLELNSTKLKYRVLYNNTLQKGPESFCSCEPKCAHPQIRSPITKDASCFICIHCNEFDRIDYGKCKSCPEGEKPTVDRMSCEPIPEQYVDYSSPWSIFATVVSVSGLIAVFLTFCVIVAYRETPVVKASRRGSMFLSLLGIAASYSMTFIILLEPNEISCAASRLGVGVCFTFCYADLLTKVVRIHRMFNNDGLFPEKLRYISPRLQLIIPGLFMIIEIIVVLVWTMVKPIEVYHLYPSRDVKLKICTALHHSSYLIGLAYPFVLIVMTMFYAIKTKNCRFGLSEARYIGFTCYATIILWLSFVPVFLIWNDYSKRVLTLAMSLSLSGWVELICLFFPKLQIVLLRPEKNTEAFVY